jgi:hypothetical protein
MPEPGTVVAALEDQKSLQFVVSKSPDAPFTITASEALLPMLATAKPVSSALPGAAETDSNATVVHPHWARISSLPQLFSKDSKRGDEQASTPKDSGTQPEPGFRLEALSTDCPDGTYTVAFLASGVPPEVLEEVADRVELMSSDMSKVSSLAAEGKRLGVQAEKLKDAQATAGAKFDVIVGADNRTTLRKVIETVKNTVLFQPEMSWREDRNGKEVAVYGTPEQALAAGAGDYYSFGMAAEAAILVRYPRGMHGLRIEKVHDFALHREIPPDTPTFPLGRIIDHVDAQGNVHYAGKLDIPVSDLVRHILITGASRTGKTVATRALVTSAVVDARQRGNTLSVVLVDNEKIGNYADQVSRGLQAKGITFDEAKVRLISPGSKGVWANLNPLRPVGINTPRDQITLVRDSFASTVEHPEAQRALGKFSGMAAKEAYEGNGWNMVTGESNFAGATPAIPDYDQFMIALKRVIASSEYGKETKGDIGGYTGTQIADMLLGTAQELFTEGYDLDLEEAATAPEPLFIELARLPTSTSKRLAGGILSRGLLAVQRKRHPDGDVDTPDVLLYQEEAAGAFDRDTSAGAENAGIFRVAGGLGLGLGVIDQGNFERMHPDLVGNTTTKMAWRTNLEGDRKALEESMGPGTSEYLRTARQGQALLVGDYLPEGLPVNFQVEMPGDLSHLTPNVTDATDLMIKGTDTEFRDGTVRVGAKDFLLNTTTGNRIRRWAMTNAELTLTGHLLPPVEEGEQAQLKKDLAKEMENNPERLAATIELAAWKVFLARPDTMRAEARSLEEATIHVRDNMLAQARGEKPPEGPPRIDLALDMGYYNFARDEVVNALTADRIVDQRYTDALGKIPGAVAAEQLNVLARKERESLDELSTALQEGVASRSAAEALKKLLGGATGEAVAAHEAINEIETLMECNTLLKPEKEGFAHIRRELELRLKRPLTAGDATLIDEMRNHLRWDAICEEVRAGVATPQMGSALAGLLGKVDEAPESVAKVRSALTAELQARLGREVTTTEMELISGALAASPNQNPANDPGNPLNAVGYPAMRRELTEAIVKKYTETPAVPLGHLEKIYNESFGEGVPPELLKAHHQLSDIAKKQAERIASSPYRHEMDKILSNILFARDPLSGGIEVDNLVMALMRREGMRGDIFDDQEAQQGRTDLSFIKLLEAGDTRITLWAQMLSKQILMGDDLRIPSAQSGYLVDKYSRRIIELRERAVAYAESRQRNQQALGQTAIKQ